MRRRNNDEFSITVRSTPFGPVAVVWAIVSGQAKVVRVLLPRDDRSAEELTGKGSPCSSLVPPTINALADDIRAFSQGADVRFSLSMAHLQQCPGFQQQVLRAEHQIPRGMVSTYAEIARHLGRPCAPRAVGNALARNPFPIIIPCHRTIRSDGSLGGFQGGTAMKRRLLELEGIEFTEEGAVVLGAGSPLYRF